MPPRLIYTKFCLSFHHPFLGIVAPRYNIYCFIGPNFVFIGWNNRCIICIKQRKNICIYIYYWKCNFPMNPLVRLLYLYSFSYSWPKLCAFFSDAYSEGVKGVMPPSWTYEITMISSNHPLRYSLHSLKFYFRRGVSGGGVVIFIKILNTRLIPFMLKGNNAIDFGGWINIVRLIIII